MAARGSTVSLLIFTSSRTRSFFRYPAPRQQAWLRPTPQHNAWLQGPGLHARKHLGCGGGHKQWDKTGILRKQMTTAAGACSRLTSLPGPLPRQAWMTLCLEPCLGNDCVASHNLGKPHITDRALCRRDRKASCPTLLLSWQVQSCPGSNSRLAV